MHFHDFLDVIVKYIYLETCEYSQLLTWSTFTHYQKGCCGPKKETPPPCEPCVPCGQKSDSSAPVPKSVTSTVKSPKQPKALVTEGGLQQHPINEDLSHQLSQPPHVEHQEEPSLSSIPRPMMLAGSTPIRDPAPVKPEHKVGTTRRHYNTLRQVIFFGTTKE